MYYDGLINSWRRWARKSIKDKKTDITDSVTFLHAFSQTDLDICKWPCQSASWMHWRAAEEFSHKIIKIGYFCYFYYVHEYSLHRHSTVPQNIVFFNPHNGNMSNIFVLQKFTAQSRKIDTWMVNYNTTGKMVKTRSNMPICKQLGFRYHSKK